MILPLPAEKAPDITAVRARPVRRHNSDGRVQALGQDRPVYIAKFFEAHLSTPLLGLGCLDWVAWIGLLDRVAWIGLLGSGCLDRVAWIGLLGLGCLVGCSGLRSSRLSGSWFGCLKSGLARRSFFYLVLGKVSSEEDELEHSHVRAAGIEPGASKAGVGVGQR